MAPVGRRRSNRSGARAVAHAPEPAATTAVLALGSLAAFALRRRGLSFRRRPVDPVPRDTR
ncbi:MAG: PEP-CTERM sorting domain-containing protein [Opitutus sp.]|nr:PEP-CTERM sorting domain-containing protein [Opitutus sp.]